MSPQQDELPLSTENGKLTCFWIGVRPHWLDVVLVIDKPYLQPITIIPDTTGFFQDIYATSMRQLCIWGNAAKVRTEETRIALEIPASLAVSIHFVL